MKKIDIKIGDRFGKYSVLELEYSKQLPSCKKIMVKCKCDCGAIREVQRQNLLFKKANQCKTCRMKQLSDDEYIKMYNSKIRIPDGEGNINGCYGGYKRGAEKRNLSFDISKEEFLIITSRNCNYCDSPPNNIYHLLYSSGKKKGQPRVGKAFIYNGIDRIDNKMGYTMTNCISCCWLCNKLKSSLDLDKFIEHIKRIYSYYGKTYDSCNEFS